VGCGACAGAVLASSIRLLHGRASAVRRVKKMPKLTVRSSNEVPQPIRASKAVQEARREYEGYIRETGNNVGELEILPGGAGAQCQGEVEKGGHTNGIRTRHLGY
jgi:hypothetical protein